MTGEVGGRQAVKPRGCLAQHLGATEQPVSMSGLLCVHLSLCVHTANTQLTERVAHRVDEVEKGKRQILTKLLCEGSTKHFLRWSGGKKTMFLGFPSHTFIL